ncbi:sigma-70 family RNA polymerase sigma factor [Chitinophaga polysaccharea]|uniref:sigma-70 family RNA polymerase sigma factor n=1 Tax=Chitinophaga polysaccharea TaxID=1293035 RepID=UPI001454F337|nr:sigma-70 family RNA polymerase sigma factor [Chitinophaga polysaccharea]NLR62295.1 sigma-70 family RNA polymerase sigma factor [Chitinophaga polysaccharea]
MEEADIFREIDEQLTTLPKKTRIIFLLSRRQQLSMPEIAQRLNLSEKTVRNQLHLALKTLRHHIAVAMLLADILS